MNKKLLELIAQSVPIMRKHYGKDADKDIHSFQIYLDKLEAIDKELADSIRFYFKDTVINNALDEVLPELSKEEKEALKVTLSYKRPMALRQGGVALTEYTGKTVEDLQKDLCNAAGTVKLYLGVLNNACYYAMTDSIDAMKKTTRYRHEVKRCLNQALQKWKEYENALIYADENRFFSLEDMPETTRKKYGNITKRQYYEYWQASGGEGYVKVKNDIGCLRHKYYRSLVAHGVKEVDAEGLAWLMVTMAMFEGACQCWETVVQGCSDASGIPVQTLRTVFTSFRLDKVKDTWKVALYKSGPEVTWDLDPEENKNIQFGLDDLFTKLSDIDYIYSSQQSAIEQYEEVFRTKGEWKKQQRIFAEAKEEIMES